MNKNRLSGRYQIEKEVGRGAMGVVYQAWDPKACREVAIKVLLSEHSGKLEYLERFEREARAMGQLAHDHIVRLFDVGCDGDDHYLVMEYFPSKNLAQIMFEEGLLSERTVLKIALQVAEGLSYAHGKGIIHRDIKPGNIMLDQAGQVKIADFGIAKILPSLLAPNASLTRLGAVLGTEKYMSPEQAEAASIDGQSDLYSLGVVMSELLTGKRKIFTDPETLKLGGGPPAKEDAQKISNQLKMFLKALLQKDRAQRVSDAATAVKMIEAILANENRRRFSGKALTLVVALFLIAGGAFYFFSENALTGFDAGLQMEKKKEQPSLEKKRVLQEEIAEKKRLAEVKEKRLSEQQQLALGREKEAALEKKRIAQKALAEKQRLAEVKEKRLSEQKLLVLAREKEAALEKKRIAQKTLVEKQRLAEIKEKRLAEEQKQIVLAKEKEAALEKKRIAQKVLAEKQRLAQIKEKKLAEKRRQAALAKAAQNAALFAVEDLRRLNGKLKIFEKSYENKALSRLASVSLFSPGTAQLLERIFETYATVDVSVSQPRVKENVAEFIVSIERLTRQNGITNYASSRWKNHTVTIRKKEGQWGKFEW